MSLPHSITPVDVLAIGAHPDDVEVGVGGTVCKLVRRGYTVAILDLTKGELASRGTVEERLEEATAAARALGVQQRINADLPDGQLTNSTVQQRRLIPYLRAFRPQMLLAPMSDDRHPDHEAAHALARDAHYFAGLSKIDAPGEPHRAPRVYYYRVYKDATPPAMIVDISAECDSKQVALKAYRSQFFNEAYAGEATYVSSPAFWNLIRDRAAYWGARIGAAYGEPLFTTDPPGVDLPPGLENAPCASE